AAVAQLPRMPSPAGPCPRIPGVVELSMDLTNSVPFFARIGMDSHNLLPPHGITLSAGTGRPVLVSIIAQWGDTDTKVVFQSLADRFDSPPVAVVELRLAEKRCCRGGNIQRGP